MTDKGRRMGTATWLHHCQWCDWSREASSPTMLAPVCERWWGLLEPLPEPSGTCAQAQLRAVAPHLSPAYGRLLRFMLVVLMLFAAARLGWHAGGFGLALTGVGIVGLFTAPIIG